MLVKTRCFGEIEINDDKVITFEDGILGMEDYKQYTLIYNTESEAKSNVLWLQSIEEQSLALPLVNPLCILDEYNPLVDEDIIKKIGEYKEEDLLVLVSMTVPADITKMTVNLRAPFIINSDNNKAVQVILDNQDYPIKYDAYSVLKKKKEEKE